MEGVVDPENGPAGNHEYEITPVPPLPVAVIEPLHAELHLMLVALADTVTTEGMLTVNVREEVQSLLSLKLRVYVPAHKEVRDEVFGPVDQVYV